MANSSPDRVPLPAEQRSWPELKRCLEKIKCTGNTANATWKLLTELHNTVQRDTTPRASHISGTNYAGLKRYYDIYTDDGEKDELVLKVIPFTACMVLDSKKNTPLGGLKVSKQQEAMDRTLERRFVANLLAMGFLCLVGERRRSEKLPNFSFKKLYAQLEHSSGDMGNFAKLKMVVHYFLRLSDMRRGPTGQIRYVRVVQSLTNDELKGSTKLLAPLYVDEEKTIEDSGSKFLQVDFANKYLGGGVLGNGKVQEEIRFSVCPELMSAMLFVECMDPNEAVVIRGFEQFSASRGYSQTLEYAGDYTDDAERDKEGNVLTTLVAIDALPYKYMKGEKSELKQYEAEYYLQEITKAYAGFIQPYSEVTLDDVTPSGGADPEDREWLDRLDPSHRRPVATGNWGCGAFGGDPQFKAMLQWLAASLAECPAVVFYTRGGQSVRALPELAARLRAERRSVGWLYHELGEFAKGKADGGPERFFQRLGKEQEEEACDVSDDDFKPEEHQEDDAW